MRAEGLKTFKDHSPHRTIGGDTISVDATSDLWTKIACNVNDKK